MHVGVMQEWSGTGSRDGISKLKLENFLASLVMLESDQTYTSIHKAAVCCLFNKMR